MPTRRTSDNRPLLSTHLPIFYGWLILPVAGLAIFVSGPGQTYTVSIFVDPIIEEMGWSRTLVSSMYTAGSLSAAASMVIVGRLLDRYGARIMLTIVGILFGLAVISMSSIHHPLELYLGFAALRTLGQGSLSLIPTTLISLWFVRRRGKAAAIVSLAGAASQAIIPPITHLLISRLGWRNAWVALAFMVWGLLILPVITLVRRNPESVGLRPDGDRDPVSARPIERKSDSSNRLEVDWSLGEAAHTAAFWLLLFAGSSQSLISTALMFHQVSLFATKGLDASLAAITLTVMAVMSMAGTLIGGLLADRFPNRYILASAQIVVIIAMLWTFVMSQPWEALVYGGMLGIGGGLFMTMNTVIWPNYFGRKHLGTIRGIAMTSMVGSAALGPLPFAFLFDATGGYTIAIISFLALPAACTLAALLAFPPTKRL